jgi:hypothetical protein
VIKADLDLSSINLDGTQTLAKKGGESVAYQGRKKGKTSNILPITDANGYIIASTGIVTGNHNDAYELKSHLQTVFKDMKQLGLDFQGAYLNADGIFDTKEARKTCFNYGVTVLSLEIHAIFELLTLFLPQALCYRTHFCLDRQLQAFVD